MSDKKPKWLQALEAQSWQAELIASGLAIYGSLALGSYIDNIAVWSLLKFNERTLSIISYLLIYLYTAHAIMVVSFIVHLVLRILWAGILGLSSVFPKGINLESKAYPQHFKEKLKEEYPSLSNYSLELDRSCSMIFSILCAMVVVFINISIYIILYLIISFFLLKFLPESVVNFIGFSVVGVLFLVSIILTFLTQGKFKNSTFSKKYAYKINAIFTKAVYLIGGKSFIYISQTIRTNTNSKSFYIGMFVIMMGSMLAIFPKLLSDTNQLFKDDFFANVSPEQMDATKSNYKDLWNEEDEKYILYPFIQSELVSEDFLQLYIPKFQREQVVIDSICGEPYRWNDSIPKQENRKLRMRSRQKCAKKYYIISIDDKVYSDLEFNFKKDFYKNSIGYQVFISLDSISKGNHVLKIESKYKAGAYQYVRSIPFYKTD